MAENCGTRFNCLRIPPHTVVNKNDPAQLDWYSILSSGDNRLELDNQVSQRSTPDIQPTWDSDCIISWDFRQIFLVRSLVVNGGPGCKEAGHCNKHEHDSEKKLRTR